MELQPYMLPNLKAHLPWHLESSLYAKYIKSHNIVLQKKIETLLK